MLWNRFCVVVLSVVAHGRAIPLLWQTLEHPSASVSASVSIALLEKADRFLAGFESITLLADRAFPCDELIAWFRDRPHWSYVQVALESRQAHSSLYEAHRAHEEVNVMVQNQGLLKVCPSRHPAQSLTAFSWRHPAPDPCQRRRSRPLLQPRT
jgi:hypothetical protein